MSPLTFTWQPKRQSSWICLRLKKPVSVGRISPPPSVTWHRHIPQVPPPPQAEGRKILLLLSVDNNVLPDSTSEISPLMFNLTGPEGDKRALA